jgi:hypothetical protein
MRAARTSATAVVVAGVVLALPHMDVGRSADTIEGPYPSEERCLAAQDRFERREDAGPCYRNEEDGGKEWYFHWM